MSNLGELIQQIEMTILWAKEHQRFENKESGSCTDGILLSYKEAEMLLNELSRLTSPELLK